MSNENKASVSFDTQAKIKKIMDEYDPSVQLAYEKILTISKQKNNNDEQIDANDIARVIDEISSVS